MEKIFSYLSMIAWLWMNEIFVWILCVGEKPEAISFCICCNTKAFDKHFIIKPFQGVWMEGMLFQIWRSMLSLFDFLSSDLILCSYCAPDFGGPKISCLFESLLFCPYAYNQFVLKSILFLCNCCNKQK